MLQVLFYCASCCRNKIRKEDGVWEWLAGIAVALVIIAFYIVPQMKTFTDSVSSLMNSWWSSIGGKIFSTTSP